MKNKALLSVTTELFWWILSLFVAALSIIPLAGIIRQDLLLVIGGLAAIFIAYFRYSIFFNKVGYFKPVGVKVLLLLANIAFFFWLLNNIQEFLSLFDNQDISFFITGNSTLSGEMILGKFELFKKEFLFFSVGTLILLLFLELLLLGGVLERVRKIE